MEDEQIFTIGNTDVKISKGSIEIRAKSGTASIKPDASPYFTTTSTSWVDVTGLYKDPESEIGNIEQTKIILHAIEDLFKEVQSQNKLLKETFSIIRELKEEQRLEHPFVDKLYQMALEWGLDPIDPENDV